MFSVHKINSVIPSVKCSLKAEEQPVQNGLALTPADMMKMAADGIPVSPQNLGNVYSDGSQKISFNVPLDQRRGVDVGDLWEQSISAKKKVRAYSHAVADAQNAERSE